MDPRKIAQAVIGALTLFVVYLVISNSLAFGPMAIKAVPTEQIGTPAGDMLFGSALWIYNALASLGITVVIWAAKGFQYVADWLMDAPPSIPETRYAAKSAVIEATEQVVGNTSPNGDKMSPAERAKWLTQNHMDPARRREWEKTLLLAIRAEDEDTASIAINALTKESWEVRLVEE